MAEIMLATDQNENKNAEIQLEIKQERTDDEIALDEKTRLPSSRELNDFILSLLPLRGENEIWRPLKSVHAPDFASRCAWRLASEGAAVRLPEHVLRIVCSGFVVPDLVAFSQTCKHFHRASRWPLLLKSAPGLEYTRTRRIRKLKYRTALVKADDNHKLVLQRVTLTLQKRHSPYHDAIAVMLLLITTWLAPLALDGAAIPLFVTLIPALLGFLLWLLMAIDLLPWFSQVDERGFILPTHNFTSDALVLPIVRNWLDGAPLLSQRIRFVVGFATLFTTTLLVLVHDVTAMPLFVVFIPALLFSLLVAESGWTRCDGAQFRVRLWFTTGVRLPITKYLVAVCGLLMTLFFALVTANLAGSKPWSWTTIHTPLFIATALVLFAGELYFVVEACQSHASAPVAEMVLVFVAWLFIVAPFLIFALLLSLKLDNHISTSFSTVSSPLLAWLTALAMFCVGRIINNAHLTVAHDDGSRNKLWQYGRAIGLLQSPDMTLARAAPWL